MSANHGKASPPAKKLVWRISDKAPLGEIVDLAMTVRVVPAAAAASIDTVEVTSGGWIVSSFDLLSGTDVTEGTDTVPADLFDELFPQLLSTAKVPEAK